MWSLGYFQILSGDQLRSQDPRLTSTCASYQSANNVFSLVAISSLPKKKGFATANRTFLTKKTHTQTKSLIPTACLAVCSKRVQIKQWRAVAESRFLRQRASSSPQFIINNSRFLPGVDSGNVITLYCPQLVISWSAIRKIRVIKASGLPRMRSNKHWRCQSAPSTCRNLL